MKINIHANKSNFRFVKYDGRFKVIRRPIRKAGRIQPGHRIKRM
jgi:hypothetical protein